MIPRALLVLLALPACFSEVDVEISPEEYRDFFTIEVVGEAPGHADSVRRIYVNDDARSFTGVGLYPVGSIMVKEIYERESDDTAGALRYIAIQRKLEVAPDGGELDNGWLYTFKADEDAAETHRPRCWKTCHQNAPFDGAFFNWSAAAD